MWAPGTVARTRLFFPRDHSRLCRLPRKSPFGDRCARSYGLDALPVTHPINCTAAQDSEQYTNITDLDFQFSPSVKHAAVVAQPVQRVGVLDGFPQPADHVKLLARFRIRLRLELHRVRPRSFGIDQRQHQKSASVRRSSDLLRSRNVWQACREALNIGIVNGCWALRRLWFFHLTGIFSGDHFRLRQVPQRSRKEQPSTWDCNHSLCDVTILSLYLTVLSPF